MIAPEHLDQYFARIPADGLWWVAMSGGADSLALLHLSTEWCRRQGLPSPHAVHIHHGINTAADTWMALCQRHCAKLNVELTVIHTDPIDADAPGLEASARVLRYRAFEDLLSAGEVLLMGHHLDDQVETVLFRLLRGSGPQGLRGIPAQRPLGQGTLARPLLSVSKSALEDWLSERGVEFAQDPANEDQRFDRNYLRHTVLPAVETRWPEYRRTVARAAQLQGEWLDSMAPPGERKGGADQNVAGEPCLAIAGEADPSRWAVTLHRWLTELGQLSPDRARLLEFARQTLEAADDRMPELPLSGCRLLRWRQAVHCAAPMVATCEPVAARVGELTRGFWGELHWRSDPARPGLPRGQSVHLRPARAGEQVEPLGRPRRPVTQWWQESGVPPWWRQQLPIVCNERDQPLAVMGCGLCEPPPGEPLTAGGLLPVWLPNPATSQLSD